MIANITFFNDKIWINSAFIINTSRNEQNKGTYITDVIIPLLQASLSRLLNGNICLNMTECQSLVSKT